MKMSSRARLVAFGAAIVVLAGCSEATGPNIPGIEVTVSLSDQEVAVGDIIEIQVLATNITAGELSFTTNTCVLVVRILNQSNTPVVDFPNTCNDIGVTTTLGPGESLAQVARFDDTHPAFPLASGTYMVIAGISSDLLNPSAAVELRIEP